MPTIEEVEDREALIARGVPAHTATIVAHRFATLTQES